MSGLNINEIDAYDDVLSEIGEEKIRERLDELINTAKGFIKEVGLEEATECSERIMFQVVLDYFSDIIRLKEFHGIEHVRQEKILAYEIAWLIKRKPIQLKKEIEDQSDIYINERFAAFLYMNDLLESGEYFIDDSNIVKYDNYLNLLFYYFKYRECNPQVIELSIEAFKLGTLVIKP